VLASNNQRTGEPYIFEMLKFALGVIANSTGQFITAEFQSGVDFVIVGQRSQPSSHLLFIIRVETEGTKSLERAFIWRERWDLANVLFGICLSHRQQVIMWEAEEIYIVHGSAEGYYHSGHLLCHFVRVHRLPVSSHQQSQA